MRTALKSLLIVAATLLSVCVIAFTATTTASAAPATVGGCRNDIPEEARVSPQPNGVSTLDYQLKYLCPSPQEYEMSVVVDRPIRPDDIPDPDGRVTADAAATGLRVGRDPFLSGAIVCTSPEPTTYGFDWIVRVGEETVRFTSQATLPCFVRGPAGP